jgi:hypothetical protein
MPKAKRKKSKPDIQKTVQSLSGEKIDHIMNENIPRKMKELIDDLIKEIDRFVQKCRKMTPPELKECEDDFTELFLFMHTRLLWEFESKPILQVTKYIKGSKAGIEDAKTSLEVLAKKVQEVPVEKSLIELVNQTKVVSMFKKALSYQYAAKKPTKQTLLFHYPKSCKVDLKEAFELFVHCVETQLEGDVKKVMLQKSNEWGVTLKTNQMLWVCQACQLPFFLQG